MSSLRRFLSGALLLILAHSGIAGTPPSEEQSPSRFAEWKFPQAEKSAASNIDSRLQRLVQQALARGDTSLLKTLPHALEQPGMRSLRSAATTERGLLLEVALADTGEALQQALRQAGADIIQVYPRYGGMTVVIDDPRHIQAIAAIPGVYSISTGDTPIRRAGSVLSRAPVALRVDQAFSRYGVDGSGQILAIISDSFARTDDVRGEQTTPAAGEPGILEFSKPQISQDLPAQVRLYADNLPENDTFSVTDEGAAMAELAYDVAPGLGIAFHTVGPSRRAFASAIDFLCSEGRASIVVDDVAFLEESYYQKGVVAQAASRCVANGTPYFSAAGNDGDQAFRYEYRRTEGGEIDTQGRSFHAWDSDQGTAEDPLLSVTIGARESVWVVLQWNQPSDFLNPGNGAQIDLDLYAFNPDGSVAVSSTDTQGDTGAPMGNPVEFIRLDNSGSNSGRQFLLAVEHFQGEEKHIPQNPQVALEFRLLFIGNVAHLEYLPNGPAVWGHPMASGVISVAAVPWWQAPNFDPSIQPTAHIDPQFFSSRGGDIPLHFDAAGNFIGETRRAPTLSAVDGNNNTFFGRDLTVQQARNLTLERFGEPDGRPNFFGTSAAAPNAAAVAALLLQFDSTLSPAGLRDILVQTAIDVRGERAAPGEDDVSGAGLIDADAAIAWLEAHPPGSQSAEITEGTGSSGGGGGCFIATAAFGTELAPELDVLRGFRDTVLLEYAGGRWFVNQYYRLSPPLAAVIEDSALLAALTRGALTPVIYVIKHPPIAMASLSLALLLLWLLWVRAGWRAFAIAGRGE